MTFSELMTFIADNFTALLSAITILSFIINIVQYKTNRDIQYHLDSIYQSSVLINESGKTREIPKEEYIAALYIIRIQAVSALRALGIRRDYGYADNVTSPATGFLYRNLRFYYNLALKIREKYPNLVKKDGSDIQEDKYIAN